MQKLSAGQYAHAVKKSHVTVIKFVNTDKVYSNSTCNKNIKIGLLFKKKIK
jgi:hypothetical protein